MIPQSAIEKIEGVILEEIDRRSQGKLWRKDRHDLAGAYDDCGNPRFTVKLMPGVTQNLMIKCSSGTKVTYFIYGTNLLGGNVKLTDPEFWKDLLKNIGSTFPKAYHWSNLEAGVNRVLSVDPTSKKVKGQKFRFDIDEVLPLIPNRDVHIQDISITVVARDKHSKNSVILNYKGNVPFLRDIEQEARIKLSQLRFQDENQDYDSVEPIKENEANKQTKEWLVDFYRPQWNYIKHPLFDNN